MFITNSSLNVSHRQFRLDYHGHSEHAELCLAAASADQGSILEAVTHRINVRCSRVTPCSGRRDLQISLT